jgi:hypothetical protein
MSIVSRTCATRRAATCAALLGIVSCDSVGRSTAVDTPPTEPTHHAVVEGVVLRTTGEPLSGIGVGVRFAASSPAERRASVVGGTATTPDGSYRLVVQAIRPRLEGLVEFYVLAQMYGPPGGRLRSDSVLTSARFVPLDRAPLRVMATELRLAVP